MVHLPPRFRWPKRNRLVAVAYCCTAWDGPGASLAELRARCLEFAGAHGLRIDAWATEVTPDVVESRYTSLLRYTIEFANDPETDTLLIAESNNLVLSCGSAAVIARALSPFDSKVVSVDMTCPAPA
ncbi:hypothetical protein [Amycolatopsis anabasis]|uniref:hypothetical protein n=1 Tax=Amycolatopsis anabasis TaxID=1840409 RepID=UPI00131E1467|nr:hypothetical protein [Amycolatopsis anabasis]